MPLHVGRFTFPCMQTVWPEPALPNVGLPIFSLDIMQFNLFIWPVFCVLIVIPSIFSRVSVMLGLLPIIPNTLADH